LAGAGILGAGQGGLDRAEIRKAKSKAHLVQRSSDCCLEWKLYVDNTHSKHTHSTHRHTSTLPAESRQEHVGKMN